MEPRSSDMGCPVSYPLSHLTQMKLNFHFVSQHEKVSGSRLTTESLHFLNFLSLNKFFKWFYLPSKIIDLFVDYLSYQNILSLMPGA